MFIKNNSLNSVQHEHKYHIMYLYLVFNNHHQRVAVYSQTEHHLVAVGHLTTHISTEY
jgi:hypothetical protein